MTISLRVHALKRILQDVKRKPFQKNYFIIIASVFSRTFFFPKLKGLKDKMSKLQWIKYFCSFALRVLYFLLLKSISAQHLLDFSPDWVKVDFTVYTCNYTSKWMRARQKVKCKIFTPEASAVLPIWFNLFPVHFLQRTSDHSPFAPFGFQHEGECRSR